MSDPKNMKYRKKKTPMQKRIRNYRKGASQLYNDVSYLKGLINTEFKAVTQTYSQTVDSSGTAAANVQLITPPTRGDDYNQRDGRTVRYKSVQIEGVASMSSSATATNVYMALVWIPSPKGVAPTFVQLLDNITTIGLRNLDYRKDLIVLKKWRFPLNINGVRSREFKFYRKLNHKCIFNNGSAGAITDIQNGAFYMFLLSNEATNTPSISFHIRTRFIDN